MALPDTEVGDFSGCTGFLCTVLLRAAAAGLGDAEEGDGVAQGFSPSPAAPCGAGPRRDDRDALPWCMVGGRMLPGSGHKTARRSFIRLAQWRLIAVGIIGALALPMPFHGERPQTPDFHVPAGRLDALLEKNVGRVVLKRVNERHGLIPGNKLDARLAW
jgi:hypothetical protein